LISNFFYNKTCPLLWIYMFIIWTWWKTKLYKNFKIFKIWRKGLQGEGPFFLTIWQKKCSMGSKCLAWGVGHMCKEKSCQKTCLVVHWNSFLEFLKKITFLVANQNIHTQLHLNVKTHHQHMNYFKLENSIFSVNVSSKCNL
jgi:hypothetical protein